MQGGQKINDCLSKETLVCLSFPSPGAGRKEERPSLYSYVRNVTITNFLIPKPRLHDNLFGTVPVWIWRRCLKFAARLPSFLLCKWKNSWHECPKTDGCRDHVDRSSRPPYVLGHSCHGFFHLHDKNEGYRAANLEGKRIVPTLVSTKAF